MSSAAPILVPAGPGRRFEVTRTIRLGDVLPSGRVRVDALARYLQDVASDDGSDAGIDRDLAWVVRRSGLRIDERPRYGQRLDLVTWASGTGSRWAERRTSISVAGQVYLEAVALWVCVDIATLRPARLSERFWTQYGDAVGGRTVSSRLQHPEPQPGVVAAGRPWPLRVADFDLFDHVNNAVAWAAVEDEVVRVAPAGRIQWADVEYRTPIERDAAIVVASRAEGPLLRVWLLADDTVVASAAVGLDAGRGEARGG